jgi:hypothetical protein
MVLKNYTINFLFERKRYEALVSEMHFMKTPHIRVAVEMGNNKPLIFIFWKTDNDLFFHSLNDTRNNMMAETIKKTLLLPRRK